MESLHTKSMAGSCEHLIVEIRDYVHWLTTYQAFLAEDVLAVEQSGAPVVVVADGTGTAGTGGLQLLGTWRSPETL